MTPTGPASTPSPAAPALDPARDPRLLDELRRATLEAPLDRKLLVGRSRGEARSLLRTLALRGVAWTGWEPTKLRPLALRVAGPRLAAEGLQVVDAFQEQALLDEAIDAVLGPAGAGGELAGMAALAEGVGFRRSLAGAVVDLRLAGVPVRGVESAPLPDGPKKTVLSRVLAAHEALLRERGLTDTAGVVVRAVRALEDGPRSGNGAGGVGALEGARIHLLPGLPARGVFGRLVALLRERGARVLCTDPVVGASSPPSLLQADGPPVYAGSWIADPGRRPDDVPLELELFHAAGVTEELREVLRRALQRGLRWDEVEIVTPDPAVYGSALHALTGELGIPVTFGVGLPVERTRPGRIAATWLRWIESGFPSDLFRGLLESGDLEVPAAGGSVKATALARRLRRLRVGWGRERYLPAIDRALQALDLPDGAREDEDPEATRRRRNRERRELRALRALLAPVLRETPPVPDRLGVGGEPVSPAELAAGLQALLRHARPASGPDATAGRRIDDRLGRMRATLVRKREFRAAVALLRDHLAFRVPAPDTPGSAPWMSTGGYLHLTDVEHGGLSGRRATFVVGLDADRVPGPEIQDPVLQDRDRRALPGHLATAGERAAERRWALRALLARLRGVVTLSYRSWESVEGRTVTPSPFLLQALRLRERDPHRTFADLHRHLGPVACALPRERPALDADDAWMGALDRGGILLAGEERVRELHPAVDAGLRALAAPEGHEVAPALGFLRARPELDPRGNPDQVLSASRLEALGACPRRYLFQTVMRIRRPDDPDPEADAWLDALRRGGLLHHVFERTLRRARERGVEPAEEAFVDLALAVLDEAAEEAALETPAPSEPTRLREVEALRADVRSFVELVRREGAPWEALELAFGLDGADPVTVPLPGGPLRIRGKVDRVDRTPGGLRVVDYKTGSDWGFDPKNGVWYGGRRLQHLLYARAVESLLGEPVAVMEYHFPTPRGRNRRIPFRRGELEGGADLLDRLLEGVARGWFPATDQPSDCGYCDFREICRVRDRGRWTDSPHADWTARHLDEREELGAVRRARRFEEDG